jgi:hypothetical protein
MWGEGLEIQYMWAEDLEKRHAYTCFADYFGVV